MNPINNLLFIAVLKTIINHIEHEILLMKILICEDEEIMLTALEFRLRKQGFEVYKAQDGKVAKEQIIATSPDLIIADIVMPRLDGYQTCALIKNNADYRHIPVVMLSSKDGLFDRARGRVVGADAHLAKPFNSEDIIETAEQLLSAQGTATAPAAGEQV